MFVSSAAAKSVIGAGITAEDFFDPRNVSLFGTFQELLREGKPLDYVIVLNRCASEAEAAWATEIFRRMHHRIKLEILRRSPPRAYDCTKCHQFLPRDARGSSFASPI